MLLDMSIHVQTRSLCQRGGSHGYLHARVSGLKPLPINYVTSKPPYRGGFLSNMNKINLDRNKLVQYNVLSAS